MWDLKALPLTPRMPITAFGTFLYASLESITPNYAKSVLDYLEAPATPAESPSNEVEETFNDRLVPKLATFIESKSRRSPADCVGNVQCDLH